jgi:hypothetical protein
MLYLIEDSELSRRAIGKYIDVYHYPDGRKELRLNGTLLPTLPTTDCQKSTRARLSITSVLAEPWSLSVWCRASGITRAQSIPAGDGPSRRRPKQEGKKSQRSLDNDDMLEALKQLQSRSEDIFGKRAR